MTVEANLTSVIILRLYPKEYIIIIKVNLIHTVSCMYVVRLVYITMLQGASYAAAQWFTLVQGA